MKKILKYLFHGVLWGWSFFIVICLIVDLFDIEPMREIVFRYFTRNVLASTVTGIGFGTTSIVYTFERLRFWQQTMIHFCVGMGVYFPVAFGMGWIPSISAPIIMTSVLIAIVVFFLIWSGFYLYSRHEAKAINEKLKSQDTENQKTAK